jgi:chromosome segregation ATPase
MDARKILIRELELQRQETLDTVNDILEKLGENLLSRLDTEDGDAFPGELGEYRRLLGEIAGSEAKIKTIEADILHLKDLEGKIAEAEKSNAAKTKELSGLYARLGETLFTGEDFSEFAASFKGQAEPLAEKLRSLEDRLRELDQEKQANIFTRLGNSAQGMMVRASAAKNQTALHRVYAEAGETFTALHEQEPPAYPRIGAPLDQALTIRRELAELGESLSLLRDERQKTKAALGTDATPAKQIRDLRRYGGQTREQLQGLYVRFGSHIAEDGGGAIGAEAGAALDRVRKLRGDIAGYETKIEKLKAAIRIDEAKNEIAKMEKAIAGHRQRITAGEEAIAELEKRIEEAKGHIEEWTKI